MTCLDIIVCDVGLLFRLNKLNEKGGDNIIGEGGGLLNDCIKSINSSKPGKQD